MADKETTPTDTEELLAKQHELPTRTAIQVHATALLDYLQCLMDNSQNSDVAGLYLQQMLDIFRYIEIQSQSESDNEAMDENPEKTTPLVRFGRKLREQRRKTRLSRAALGQLTGLSEATIKLLETGRTRPTRNTLLRLSGVRELHLSRSDLMNMCDSRSPLFPVRHINGTEDVPALNFLVMPEYDGTELVLDFIRFLQGAGGYVEQTALYVDPFCALDYLTVKREIFQFESRIRPPFQEIAKRLAARSDGIEVVVLGPGDGQTETGLLKELATAQGKADLDICLFDISQPLLSTAYKHTMSLFGDEDGVRIWAVQGNFLRFPSISPLNMRLRKRTRLLVLLGFTICNLDHDVDFLSRRLQSPVGDADFLLLDVLLSMGDTSEKIRNNDPLLFEKIPIQIARWLSGPFYRSIVDVRNIVLSTKLDVESLPRNYVLTVQAEISTQNQTDRMFSMIRFRRYDRKNFVHLMKLLGWKLLWDNLQPQNEKLPIAATMLFGRDDRHSSIE